MHMVYNRELSLRLLFTAVAILSLAGNLFFIVLIVRYRKLMKNAYHVVLLNLAFTDMMTGDVIYFFSVVLWILIFYVRSNIRLVIDKWMKKAMISLRSLIFSPFLHLINNRPIRLTQCCTQSKSPGVKILCVLYLHYNVAFTFKWYGNSWNKTFYPQRVWIRYNI